MAPFALTCYALQFQFLALFLAQTTIFWSVLFHSSKELMNQPVSMPCGHSACKTCFLEMISKQSIGSRPYTCPLCRARIEGDKLNVNVTVSALIGSAKWVPKTCILRFSTSLCEGFVATPFRSNIYGTSLEMRIKSAKKELAIPWNLDLTLGQWLAKCVRPLLKCYYCSLYWLPGNRGTCRCSHVVSWTSGKVEHFNRA